MLPSETHYADISILTDISGTVLLCLPDQSYLPSTHNEQFLYLKPVEGGCLLRCGDTILGLAPSGALNDLLSAPHAFLAYPGPEGMRTLDRKFLIRFESPA